jgi:DNA polymerase IV
MAHPELADLTIAHVDCDAFYATVEKRDNPLLRDKPVIVGGGKRGVVSTCCYIARTYGVRSAMPMFKALALCPDAVIIKPDMERYRIAGRRVRERMLALTPLVEPVSIDEAFLDLTGTDLLHGGPPAMTLARFAREIETEIGITVSVGLSHNKFLAKVASDLEKPRGFSAVGRAETLAFLGSRPVSLIWGVGKAMQERLAGDGIHKIADLRTIGIGDLMRRYGSEGQRLHRLAHGIDERKVEPERETKSVSAETTFDTDVSSHDVLAPILWGLAEKVSRRAKAQSLAGRGITLKLKTADFRLLTRSSMLPEPTQLAKRIFDTARELLQKEPQGMRYRLAGIALSHLGQASEADKGDLVDTRPPLEAAAERAIDRLRLRFGAGAVIRGVGLGLDRDRKGK